MKIAKKKSYNDYPNVVNLSGQEIIKFFNMIGMMNIVRKEYEIVSGFTDYGSLTKKTINTK